MGGIRIGDTGAAARYVGPRRYRARRGVEVARPGWLRKRVDGSVTAEVAKAMAMHDALVGSPYYAPRVIPGDEPGSILVEDLGHLTSLTEMAENDSSLGDLDNAVACAACILARLHAGMGDAVPSEVLERAQTQATSPFRGGVLLHGDFSPTNIFRDESGRFVTLDGSPNFTTTTSPLTFGKAETDLATFTLVLCWPLRPLHWKPVQVKARVAARRRFLSTYRTESGGGRRWLVGYELILLVESLWFRKVLRRGAS